MDTKDDPRLEALFLLKQWEREVEERLASRKKGEAFKDTEAAPR